MGHLLCAGEGVKSAPTSVAVDFSEKVLPVKEIQRTCVRCFGKPADDRPWIRALGEWHRACGTLNPCAAKRLLHITLFLYLALKTYYSEYFLVHPIGIVSYCR